MDRSDNDDRDGSNNDMRSKHQVPCRGLQKVFKAKTLTSARSRLYSRLFMKSYQEDRNKTLTRRPKNKTEGMDYVVPVVNTMYSQVKGKVTVEFFVAEFECVMMLLIFLFCQAEKSSCLHYFHPINVKTPALNTERSYKFHSLRELRIIDGINGSHMEDGDGIPVFIKPSRNLILETNVHKYRGDTTAIKKLNSCTIHTPRSLSREGFSTTPGAPFTTAGVKANMAGHGYVCSSFCHKYPQDWNRIVKMTRRMEHLMRRVAPKSVIAAMDVVRQERDFPTMATDKGKKQVTLQV